MFRLASLALTVCALVSASSAAASGVRVLTPGQVPQRATPAEQRVHPRLSPDPAALATGKAAAQSEASFAAPLAGLQSPSAASPLVAGSGSLNQVGLSAGDNALRNDGTPPDPTGAVGPDNYVELVNSVVRVYDKSLSALSTTQLDDFVGHHNDAVFDPQIQWDEQGQRWLYLADDCVSGTCSSTNYLAYGFSMTTDPTGGWCNYFVQVDNAGGTGLFDDYPKLGHNASHLIFGVNVFHGNTFVTARVWTVPKPAAGAISSCPSAPTAHWWSGSAASPSEDQTLASHKLNTSDGTLAGTPVPADTADSAANGYVVAADEPAGLSTPAASQIMIWHVASNGALVADGNVNVSSYGFPANVPQPSGGDVLDSSDARLTQVVALEDPDPGAEAVWTQHTVDGAGGRAVVRWYELLPATLTARQEGTVSNATSFVFNGAISPAMAGNRAAIQYNVGGSSQLVQIRAATRSGSTASGTMSGEVTLGSSSDIDFDFSCPSANTSASGPSCRWGDYAGMTPDPSNAYTTWGTNQLNGAQQPNNDPAWTTRNFALLDSAPLASFAVAPNPAVDGDTVSFDGTGSSDPDGGTISKYEWDFGDGTFVVGSATDSHQYTNPGTYTVRLRVTDSDGSETDVATKTLTVLPHPPIASFTVSPSQARRGQTVTFNGSASSDPDSGQPIADYHWDFGDGTSADTGTNATATHSYSRLGTFTVTLTVTDSDEGKTDSAGQSVTIVNAPPSAALSASPSSPSAGDSVTFSAAGSSDPDGTIVDYKWDLDGDGTFETDTATTSTASRVFATAGTFHVSTRVTDSDGAAATTTIAITVAPRPATNPAAPSTKGVTLSLTVGKARLRKFLRSGLPVVAKCSKACTVTIRLVIPAKLARRLHLKSRSIAFGSRTISGAGSATVKVKVTKLARRAVAKLAKLEATVKGSAITGLGERATASRPVTLRR
jgi:PKD repeat protein